MLRVRADAAPPFPPRRALPAAEARAPGGGEPRVRRRAGDGRRWRRARTTRGGLTQLRAQVASGHGAGHSSSRRLLNAQLTSSQPFLRPTPSAPARSPRPCPSGGGAGDLCPRALCPRLLPRVGILPPIALAPSRRYATGDLAPETMPPKPVLKCLSCQLH